MLLGDDYDHPRCTTMINKSIIVKPLLTIPTVVRL